MSIPARVGRHPVALLPCPFCGSTRVGLDKTLRDGYAGEFESDPDAYAYAIRCGSCAAEGGWAKTGSGAHRYWNMRTFSQ
jgi:Lar family restriction alleviation protein